jgi:hypothetical protein
MRMGGAEDLLIPILVPLGICAMVFGIVYVKSRENMALIEKGINPKQNKASPRPFVSLKYGLLLVGSGLGLLLAYILDEVILKHGIVFNHIVDANSVSDHINDTRNPIIYFALIAIFGGAGLVLSYRIEKKEWLDKKGDE